MIVLWWTTAHFAEDYFHLFLIKSQFTFSKTFSKTFLYVFGLSQCTTMTNTIISISLKRYVRIFYKTSIYQRYSARTGLLKLDIWLNPVVLPCVSLQSVHHFSDKRRSTSVLYREVSILSWYASPPLSLVSHGRLYQRTWIYPYLNPCILPTPSFCLGYGIMPWKVEI